MLTSNVWDPAYYQHLIFLLRCSWFILYNFRCTTLWFSVFKVYTPCIKYWLYSPCCMLLLLLSHFSRVQLCVTPWMAAHQAPLSLGFSRQEHWSGLPFPSSMHESAKWSHSVVSNSLGPRGLQPTRLLHPWDFPGRSTGVGCHCLLQSPQDNPGQNEWKTNITVGLLWKGRKIQWWEIIKL